MHELAFLRFLAPKMLKSKNKGDHPFVFFNFKQLLFCEKSLENASKYPKIAIFKIDIFYQSNVKVFYMFSR